MMDVSNGLRWPQSRLIVVDMIRSQRVFDLPIHQREIVRTIAAVMVAVLAWIFAGSPAIAQAAAFKDDVFPVLLDRCFRCHGSEEQKGDVRLDSLSTDMVGDSAAAEIWHDVLGVINRGEMPPEDEPQPTDRQRRGLVNWLTQEIDRAIDAKKSTGGRPVLRRLNRVEYQNTMRDLLGIDTNFAANLPPESVSEDGFKNNGLVLQMSALQLEYYLEAARSALQKVIVPATAPEVFRHVLEEGQENGGRTLQNVGRSNVLGRTTVFLSRIEETYPENGEFLLRVRARAELKVGHGYPRLQVSIGFRADTQFPQRIVGSTDVQSESIKTYEFRGRIEDFPLPSRTQSKFPGLLIKVTNLYDDGSPIAEPSTEPVAEQGKKKRKRQKVWKVEDHMPKIHLESVEFIGPVFESWPPKHHTDILFPSRARDRNERGYVTTVLKRFMARAYRRPVAAEELNPFLLYFDKARETLPTFEEAIRETLAMVLVSPDFLYLMEPSGSEKRLLNDWEIASRLSYFLWSTMPDEGLFTAAEERMLTKPAKLRRITSRMLADPRCWQFIDQFVDQWLDVSAVDRVAVNPEFYPLWDDDLKPSIRGEARHFFAEILQQRLSALNFLDSDFAMLNAPLARHYGLAGPRGMEFERVELPPSHERGGVLAQASMLLGNSTGEDSHPVKRAVWIRERLLDDPPADPPPNVPSLDAENPDFAQLSVRRQLEAHRQQASCNDCHRGIDPWGIALEQFGADGLLRDVIPRREPDDRKKMFDQVVESSTTLPDGSAVAGLADLKAYLLAAKSERFARALVAKLLAYALGRSLELTDEAAIEKLTTEFIDHDYQLHFLVRQIVTSEAFLTK
jgi:hypothetical protein